MKQILQSLKDGKIEVVSVPCPAVKPGHLLIQTSKSLISAGTERMLVEFGKANLVDKARQQPDKVRAVLTKIKTDGLLPTIESVLNKLDQPLAMGYCNVGSVVGIGRGVTGFSIGDLVASNGKHAEVVSVPVNLCVKVPGGVLEDQAVFTVIGAIALQGVRLAQPTLGETIVVMGLGLIGLMTVQILRRNGCRVLALDLDSKRLALAQHFGAEVLDISLQDPVKAAEVFSRARGVDAVIVTASTKSSDPIHQAAMMCRKRGRIVLVGVTGLELSRDDFYQKELTFQVSASYGPGRYDLNYEEKGQDYPVGFVRWTAKRNFEAVLDMMADGAIDVKSLLSHRFSIEEAEKAYGVVCGEHPSLGILLEYPNSGKINSDSLQRTVSLPIPKAAFVGSKDIRPSISFIGSGHHATGVLMPAFQKAGARLRFVASTSGVSDVHAARKYGFEKATTDVEQILSDIDTHAVVIATRHDSHAELVVKALEAGKHVFVEKPLALTLGELEKIESSYSAMCGRQSTPPILMVGFNRRFAPHVVAAKQLLSQLKVPKSFVMTVNAGSIPQDHWTQDSLLGGGRILGEGCHFVDLLRYLAGSPIKHSSLMSLPGSTRDTVSLQLEFSDGSIGTVHYFSNGSREFPKERLEIFVAGRVLQVNNFRTCAGFGWPKFKKMNLWRQDKGQKACAAAFLKALEQGGSPIPYDELMEVARVSIDLAAAVAG